MAVVEDMKRVAEEIVSSYQSRISTVATIIDNTHQILDDFKIKRNEISNQLKETLARGESLRKKDFDNMMKDILSHQDEREKRVKELLKTFFEEQKEVAEIIKKSLTGVEKIRIDDFKKMLQDIQAKQRTRENEVSVRLKEFQTEYKEMAESLRSLLDKREAIRIKDFKDVMGNIRSRQMERAKEVRTRLDESRKERQYGLLEWNRLTAVMAEKRVEGGEVREKEEVAQGK
jgi:flagellar biosynthesis chaperone FliJ